MTKNQLVSLLCKIEGKKSQVKVGDMREIIAILFLLIENRAEVQDLFAKQVKKGHKNLGRVKNGN